MHSRHSVARGSFYRIYSFRISEHARGEDTLAVASRRMHRTVARAVDAESAVADDGSQEIERWIDRNTFRVDGAGCSCRTMSGDTRPSLARCLSRSPGKLVGKGLGEQDHISAERRHWLEAIYSWTDGRGLRSKWTRVHARGIVTASSRWVQTYNRMVGRAGRTRES